MTNDYPLRLELRIDWSEIDSFGHVNNLAIMRYVQSTRVHILERVGLMQHHTDHGAAPVLAQTTCQFKKQLFYPGQVAVCARIDHIKNTSFQISYALFNETGDLFAEARDVLVMFDFEKNAKCPIPPAFRKKFVDLGAASTM